MDHNAFANAGEFLRHDLEAGALPAPAQERLETYYRNWQRAGSARIFHWYNYQLREIDRLIAAQPAPRVLDAGAGTGSESLWFALNGAEVLGADVDEQALNVARARLDALNEKRSEPLSCSFRVAPITDIEGEFDIIWLEQAFHHMEPRDAVLRKLADLTRPGGHVVFSETNAWNPLIQFVLYRMRGTRTIVHHQGVIWGHERILTPRSLARQLRRVGFDVESTEYFRVFPAGKRFERTLVLEKMLKYGPLPRLLFPIFTHYSLVARRT